MSAKSVLKVNPDLERVPEDSHQPYDEQSWYVQSNTTPANVNDDDDVQEANLRRTDDHDQQKKPGFKQRIDLEKEELSRAGIVPEFTGSAMGVDRHENVLFHVPIDAAAGTPSFGTWPYPGKGLYGLGYNFKPIAAFVMPILLIAGLGLLYTSVINVARFGRRKRSVTEVDATEDVTNGKASPSLLS
jgi:hypothetical protein